MSALDIVDELAAVLEPVAAKRDASGARPVTYSPDTLYAWPRTDRLTEEGDGTLDRIDFAVRVAWSVDAGGEQSKGMRDRATTQALQDKAVLFKAAIRAHRTGLTYEDVHVAAIDWESLSSLAVRGFYVDLAGYVMTS